MFTAGSMGVTACNTNCGMRMGDGDPELTSIEGRDETTKEESRMMGFDLIVPVIFILVILGIHVWCNLSELKHPPRQRRRQRRSVPKEYDQRLPSRSSRNLTSSPR
jgi:hypothetical protein